MSTKQKIRIVIDIGMTVCLILLMPYSLLSETAHEWIGVCMLLLFIGHHIMNRRWIAAVRKGRYTAIRIIQTLLVVVMLCLMLGSMISGIVLSNHVFKALQIAAISMEARQVHIFCAYWGFVVMSVHIGFHWNMMMAKIRMKPVVLRVIAILTSAYGVYAFYKRQIGDYLLMKMHFVFYDYTESVFLFMLDYVAVMILIAAVSYYLCKLIRRSNRR